MIENTIEYVLDGIKKLDTIIKEFSNETSQEVLDTIK
jgi:hypothetical protein